MRRFAKTALGVGLALGMVVAMATTGPAVAAPPPDVATVVTAKVLDRARDLAGFRTADAADTEIRVNRTQGRWAFGTAVLRAPTEEHAAPRDWLFLAELRNGRWRVAFDGEPEFGILATAAPVLSTRERSILASHDGQSVSTAANGDYRTQMRLPWAIGQSWSLLGGPHAWDAGSGPWSSLDLAGGDQRVLAARAGLAYTTCTGRILVYHEDGYTTRYYHLWDHIWVDGQWVDEGGFLGYTGTEVGCGGSARSRHVHFSLLQNGSYVGIAYHLIGGWVFMNGGAQYQGYAWHGSQRVNVGGSLYNYGAQALDQGVVDANGGGVLNKRSGPGTTYPIVGTVTDGTVVTIACSANGTSHTGRWGTTSLWNRLSDGSWVSDAYLYTGSNNPINGWC